MKQFPKPTIAIGDAVTFDTDGIDNFKAETSSPAKAVRDYQRIVLAGVNQIGKVITIDGNLATVFYEDGWELPVPVKYLVVLPKDIPS